MKLVLSGEDDKKRGARETELIQAAQAAQQEIIRLDLRKETPALEEALGVHNLFATSQLFLLTGFEAIRSPKRLQQLVQDFTDRPDDVIILIPGKLTPAKKKAFPTPWKVEDYALPAVLFQFLENIKLKPLNQIWPLYQQSLESGSEWGMHALLTRQFRLLLATKTNAPVAAPPFQLNKLKQQSQKFTTEQLVHTLEALFQIEKSIKTGTQRLSWVQQFDIHLVKLYDDLKTGQ